MRRKDTAKDRCVYVMFRADGTPFYVGKGAYTRLTAHLCEVRSGKNTYKCRVMRQTIELLGEVPVVVVRENLVDTEACQIEVALIAAIGRFPVGPLVNLTDGGEGMAGWRPPPETIDRLKTALGKPEVKLKRSLSMKAVYVDNPNKREQQRRSHTTPQFIENMRLERADPGYKDRQSEAIKAGVNTPEARAKKSAAMKRIHADPVIKAKQTASIRAALAARSPEQKEVSAAKMRAAWVIRKQRMADLHSAS